MTEPNNRPLFHRLFVDHPASIEETYAEHLGSALLIGFRLMGMGMACLCHALVPALFEDAASRGVRRLAGEISARRSARNQARVTLS